MKAQAHDTRHFAFGKNWLDFSERIDEARIRQAEGGLQRLLPAPVLEGKSFLDIGCGSGLSSLAAIRLGCERVLAIDIDADSVAAAGALLQQRAPGANWRVERGSVFSLDPEEAGLFDVVYSWGVLHHTGDLRAALRSAARLVDARGHQALALYRKTPLCGFWRLEKRLYSSSSGAVQALARALYLTVMRAAFIVRRRSFHAYCETYRERGMSFSHDVHDWLGGHPYEPALPEEVRRFVTRLGFTLHKELLCSPGLGILGSDNDEYVFRRHAAPRVKKPPSPATTRRPPAGG